MREIKFRAWDTADKTMNEVAWLRYENGQDLSNVGIYWNDGQHNGATRTIPPRAILMQYTGLKDKNGVEIYEGDIIQDGSPKHGNKFTVEYGNIEDFNDMSGDPNIGIGFNVSENKINTYEVIGNIYANPELLNGNKE